MPDIDKVINEAVSFIHSNEESKRKIADRLSPLKEKNLEKFKSRDLLEEKLCYAVEEKQLNGKIAGVDSGFIGKKLSAIDLVLIRAVGAVLEYKNSKIQQSSYHPALYQFPVPHLTNNALERDEFACSKSLMRLKEEVNTAKELIEKFSPGYCFLDGSIIPQYQDKPRKDSRVNELYKNILEEFQSLYTVAEKNSCELIACVEDSRGSRCMQIIQEEVLPKEELVKAESLDNLFDSSLLDYLLNKGERSFAFSYTKNIEKHPILMDFKEKWSKNIYGFYLKPSLYDRPLRVELICKQKGLTEYCNNIASITYALSSMHREYAYPSVLIEADLRARLKPDEVNIVFNRIIDRLGKNIKLRLRRDKRPF